MFILFRSLHLCWS